MKIRQLEKKLSQSGYQKVRNGKGSHRIFKHPITHHTISLSGKKSDKAQPYQLKLIK